MASRWNGRPIPRHPTGNAWFRQPGPREPDRVPRQVEGVAVPVQRGETVRKAGERAGRGGIVRPDREPADSPAPAGRTRGAESVREELRTRTDAEDALAGIDRHGNTRMDLMQSGAGR